MGNRKEAGIEFAGVRPSAVAGTFYPADASVLRRMIDSQLDYARGLLQGMGKLLPAGAPKAVIVPHAGYVYSGTTAALAYALLERGRGTVRRAVVIGPTHRVGIRGVACPSAAVFRTPLGDLPIDIEAERRVLREVPCMSVHDRTHEREHAVEVQVPFLQTVLGNIDIVPLNAGDASPREVGDVIRALWSDKRTIVVISSDLSHYHPHALARRIDDETIRRITDRDLPIVPDRACGAYPVNGLLDVCHGRGLRVRLLGCATSGDDGIVTCAVDGGLGGRHRERPAMAAPSEAVVGYASFAVWERDPAEHGTDAVENNAADLAGHTRESNTLSDDESGNTAEPAKQTTTTADSTANKGTGRELPDDAGPVLLQLAHASLEQYLGLADDIGDSDSGTTPIPADIVAEHPWLNDPGASFVTLSEHGRLRGCIGSLEAYRPLGRDVADHAVDAACHDPRFPALRPYEYPLVDVEVSVLSAPTIMRVNSRTGLEAALRPGIDGLTIDDGRRHRATFLPQVWDELPEPHDFVTHLLRKAGLPGDYDWRSGELLCSRYTVTAFRDGCDAAGKRNEDDGR